VQAQDQLKKELEKSYHVMRYIKREANYGSPEYFELVKAV
jgi:hypothetical protein